MSSPNVGRITQVIGSTLDAHFAEDSMPALYNALSVQVERTVLGEKTKETLWCEVAQHLGGGQVRAVSLGSTDGLQRGQEILDTGSAVTVPVGTRNARPGVQSGRRTDRRPRSGRRQGPARHSPDAPGHGRPVHEDRDLRNRHQGHRPALPPGARRQDRPLRRRRRRQDRHHPGTDRPPRPLPLRLLAASPASANAPAKATTSGSKCRRPRSATPASGSSTRP